MPACNRLCHFVTGLFVEAAKCGELSFLSGLPTPHSCRELHDAWCTISMSSFTCLWHSLLIILYISNKWENWDFVHFSDAFQISINDLPIPSLTAIYKRCIVITCFCPSDSASNKRNQIVWESESHVFPVFVAQIDYSILSPLLKCCALQLLWQGQPGLGNTINLIKICCE